MGINEVYDIWVRIVIIWYGKSGIIVGDAFFRLLSVPFAVVEIVTQLDGIGKKKCIDRKCKEEDYRKEVGKVINFLI